MVTPAFVQWAGGARTGSTDHVNITASGAGNLIAVLALSYSNSSVTVTSVTDNLGQIYIQAPSVRATNASITSFSDIWYFPNTAAGVTRVTINYSGSSSVSEVIYEFSGISATAPIVASGQVSNGASTTTPVSAPITTLQSNTLILTLMNCLGKATAVSAGYTDSTSFFNNFGWAYSIPGTLVTSNSATYTTDPGGYCSSSVAFLGGTTSFGVAMGAASASAVGQTTAQAIGSAQGVGSASATPKSAAFGAALGIGSASGTTKINTLSQGVANGIGQARAFANLRITASAKASGRGTALGRAIAYSQPFPFALPPIEEFVPEIVPIEL